MRGSARRALWVLLASLGMPALPAGAATYYVATDGNDDNNGLSVRAPFRTLARAQRMVEPGDVIELRRGVHAGGLTVRRPGSAAAWITLRPYKKEKAVIDGAGSEVNLYFYGEEPLYWRVEGLELRGGGAYVVKIDAPRVSLVKNNLHGSGSDIVKLVKGADDVVIHGNEIHHPTAAAGANAQGIDIVGADRTYVAWNYVHDIPSIAMYAKGNATDTVFEHNTVENVYQRGIMLGQSTGVAFLDPKRPYESYNGVIRHNVIRNTGGACLATASSYRTRIHDNRCIDVASEFNGAIYVSNESELKQAGTDIEIRDNVIVRAASGRRPVVQIGPNALTDDDTLRLDRNVYWCAGGEDGVTFSWERGPEEGKRAFPSVFGASLGKWQRVTGKDARSVLANPEQLAAGAARGR